MTTTTYFAMLYHSRGYDRAVRIDAEGLPDARRQARAMLDGYAHISRIVLRRFVAGDLSPLTAATVDRRA
jgi:hypothetical protein